MTVQSTWWNENHVREYLQFGDDGQPGRREQLDILFSVLPAAPDAPMRLLDLGCGDGVLLDTLLQAYPQAARAAAVDSAPAMLERARARLKRYPSVELIETDLADTEWATTLGRGGKFDIVVSRFAIHHLEDDAKKALFRNVYGLLERDGVFVNIEHVQSRSPRGENLFEAWYAAHLARMEQASGGERGYGAFLTAFRSRPGKEANRLAHVEDQMRWMDEAGFCDVECVWKSFELAMIVGFQGDAA